MLGESLFCTTEPGVPSVGGNIENFDGDGDGDALCPKKDKKMNIFCINAKKAYNLTPICHLYH